MTLTGMSFLGPPWTRSDVIHPKGNPILLIMVPGHPAEDHLDHLRIKRLLKLLLLLPSLPDQLGELSNSDLARKKPRSLPHLPLSPNLDPLSLRGPSGNVSICTLSTSLSFADPSFCS